MCLHFHHHERHGSLFRSHVWVLVHACAEKAKEEAHTTYCHSPNLNTATKYDQCRWTVMFGNHAVDSTQGGLTGFTWQRPPLEAGESRGGDEEFHTAGDTLKVTSFTWEVRFSKKTSRENKLTKEQKAWLTEQDTALRGFVTFPLL